MTVVLQQVTSKIKKTVFEITPGWMSDQPVLLTAGIVDVIFGPDVQIVKPVNLYGCQIGANSFIGPFVEIQKGVLIGRNCRIQSHSFICELVTIGDDCFIGHGVMFINDLFSAGAPANGQKELWKQTIIGNHVSIGSNATLLPVRIADNVVVGAGSVVTKDIEKPGIYAGNPARFVREISEPV